MAKNTCSRLFFSNVHHAENDVVLICFAEDNFFRLESLDEDV